MTVLVVPPLEAEGKEWPTLGPGICRFIEDGMVFGPGDLRGEPARIDVEKRALIYRLYEVYPQGAKSASGKPLAGRRRFRRAAISMQKGSAKTELAAWLAGAELHPDGPVRCVGWSPKGRPIGGPVTDPYIPMVAYTEEQTEDLAYGALKAILENSRLARDFDIGLERIKRITGDGEAKALASAPNARDGARTTFQHSDETHRFTRSGLIRAHRTMLENLNKRPMADPWGLETTTTFTPGEGSVAEQTMEYAEAVASGDVADSALFFYHRQASDQWVIRDPVTGELDLDQVRGAVIEAAGPAASWKDIDGIVRSFQDPKADIQYLERVWLNRPVQGSAQAFNAAKWREMADPDYRVAPGALITLGFDGSLNEDATGLLATEVSTGFQWPIGIWERPRLQAGEWEVPRAEVDAAVDETFATWVVWRMYADPSKWESQLAAWAGRHGDRVVVAWPTTLYRKMATALKGYAQAIDAGEVPNNGDPVMARHIGNAQKNKLNFLDDDGSPLWLIQKDRPHSPNKIDGSMAGCLSWQARLDAVKSGALNDTVPTVGVY